MEAKDWMDFTRTSVKFLNEFLCYKHCSTSGSDQKGSGATLVLWVSCVLQVEYLHPKLVTA